jgi:hypothetical protein
MRQDWKMGAGYGDTAASPWRKKGAVKPALSTDAGLQGIAQTLGVERRGISRYRMVWLTGCPPPKIDAPVQRGGLPKRAPRLRGSVRGRRRHGGGWQRSAVCGRFGKYLWGVMEKQSGGGGPHPDPLPEAIMHYLTGLDDSA